MTSTATRYTDADALRFLDKVEAPADLDTTPCWFWKGAKHSKKRGYGKFRLKVNGAWKVVNAHKAAYLLFRGEVEAGLVLGHKCNIEGCANPWHVEPQSQSQNMQYCVASGRHVSQQH